MRINSSKRSLEKKKDGLPEREIKKKVGQMQRSHPVPAVHDGNTAEKKSIAAADTLPQIITLLHNNHLLESNSLC